LEERNGACFSDEIMAETASDMMTDSLDGDLEQADGAATSA